MYVEKVLLLIWKKNKVNILERKEGIVSDTAINSVNIQEQDEVLLRIQTFWGK